MKKCEHEMLCGQGRHEKSGKTVHFVEAKCKVPNSFSMLLKNYRFRRGDNRFFPASIMFGHPLYPKFAFRRGENGILHGKGVRNQKKLN